jgi:hypothetical protein
VFTLLLLKDGRVCISCDREEPDDNTEYTGCILIYDLEKDEDTITRVTKSQVTKCLEIAHTPSSLTTLFIYTQVGGGDTTTHLVPGSAPEDSDDDTSPVAPRFQRYQRPYMYVKPLAAAEVKTTKPDGDESEDEEAEVTLRRSNRVTKQVQKLSEDVCARTKTKRSNVNLSMVKKDLRFSPITDDDNKDPTEPEPISVFSYDPKEAHIDIKECIDKVVEGNFYHAHISCIYFELIFVSCRTQISTIIK